MWSISGASAASPQISHIERYCDSIAEAISRGEFVPVQECGPGLWPRASEEYRRVLVSKVAGAGRLIAMTNPHSLTAEWIFAELDASPEPELARELLNLHETSTLENVLETVSLVAAVS